MIRSLHLRKAIKHLITPQAQIMDAGCDTGRDAIYFSAKYPDTKIIAIDISESAISEANERLAKTNLNNVTFIVADLLYINYSEQFNIIYSIEVLEHITDLDKCIANFHKALKPNGKLIIHVPCKNQKRHFKRFKKMIHSQHVFEGFEDYELSSILQLGGFQVIDVKYTSGWFGSLAWEIFEMVRKSDFLKRTIFPVVLLLAFLDTIISNKRGNNIMVTACKLA